MSIKQFAQCANCRQWYVEQAVTTVEILQGNGMRHTALWCQPCIREAEQRSYDTDTDAGRDVQDLQSPSDSFLSYDVLPAEEGAFGELLQAHLDLMEEALVVEDAAAIASRIGEFMARGRAYLEELDSPEHVQRLTNHLNYWQTFLDALDR